MASRTWTWRRFLSARREGRKTDTARQGTTNRRLKFLPVLSALLYLQLTSLKNLLLSRLRRLRQPKYLFGAAVGAAYFWFFFFRPLGSGGPTGQFARAAGGLPAGAPGAD